MTTPTRTALVSVSDKTGLESFARALHAAGYRLFTSRGTGRSLNEWNIPCESVDALTQGEEILGGRVKTLHSRLHAGILADRRNAEHLAELSRLKLAPVDVVVCNLYPFESVAQEGKTGDVLWEHIDIGGPAMLRAAAKNVEGGVTAVCDPADYARVAEAVTAGEIPVALRRALAAKVFALTARYDAAVANQLARAAATEHDPLPLLYGPFEKARPLRYGENPHQAGALYRMSNAVEGIAGGTFIRGKELSYNNLLDLDAAWNAVRTWPHTTAAIVKHTQLCGLAEGDTPHHAFTRAWEGDPQSAFGGILALNRPLDAATAEAVSAPGIFLECIAAPGFEPAALALLDKKPSLRLYVPAPAPSVAVTSHHVSGGVVVETADAVREPAATWALATRASPRTANERDLALAWHAAALSKSNAISLVRQGQLVGYGAGQTSRVAAAEDAVRRAGERAKGAVLASDAFFPFADGVQAALRAGVSAVIQPGGSKRDAEVIAACEAAETPMYFTHARHFRH